MKTGFRGTFVISWSQTKLDGMGAVPLQSLDVGMAWAWSGDAVRVDGPSELLRLDEADGEASIRKRAAKMVRKLVGAALTDVKNLDSVDVEHPIRDSRFVVTDGAQSYTITVIDVAGSKAPLLMFLDEMPPKDVDLWVVHHTIDVQSHNMVSASSGGVICFTPGTMIETPDGARLVEDLREGDRLQTRDSGAQDIQWIGARRMTGARLFAMPQLRPIRIRAGALGVEKPDQEFLVSPNHRMLVRGVIARDLFNTSEVLVAAKDLVNGSTVTIDTQVKEVCYIHLMLPSHQIIIANGVETESFHPASTALSTIPDKDRARLALVNDRLEADPNSYGGYARRILSQSEAAILTHHAA
ncbi:MAG: Hint domain-containing protein [Planktotalea sp.]|uniref:Hint domain-containing protein n=1 Tax=Planktotalea sp. TaxID=2029877 RepID=UPI003C72A1FE